MSRGNISNFRSADGFNYIPVFACSWEILSCAIDHFAYAENVLKTEDRLG